MQTRRVMGVAHHTTFSKAGIEPPGGRWPTFGSRGVVMRHQASISCWCRPEFQWVEVPDDSPDDPYVTV